MKSRRLVALALGLSASAAFADDGAAPPAAAPAASPTAALDLTQVSPEELAATLEANLKETPPLNLSLPLGAVKLPAAKRHKQAVRKPVASLSDQVALRQGPVAVDLSGPGPDKLASGAVLNLNLPDAAVKAIAQASVGKEDGEPAFWHKDSARVTADVAGPLGTALTASGENRLSLTYRAPESVGASDTAAHLVRTETRSGQVNLAVPLDPIKVTTGASSSSEHTQEGKPGDDASFTQSAVRTDNHTAFVSAEWQPVAGLKLEGGTTARVAAIAWQDAHSSTYHSVNPHLKVDVSPWRDTTVSAKVEQQVAPYDAAAFANYAKVDKAADASGFQPDHAWQIETRVEQRVGQAKLSATYTTARQGTVTEFTDVRGVQAPASTPLVGRDSLAVALSLPLAGVGLPSTDFSSEARWQTSKVVDPVTAKMRAASGEIGEQVTLRLSHAMPAKNLSIGLTGAYTGEHTTYQLNELSTTAPGASLGAFISYRPGPYEVDLNVNGLYGAETRADYFRGDRGSSKLDHSAFQDNSGPMLKLSLKRPF